MAANKLADDIKSHAEDEAKRVVRDAQTRSDLLLEKTQSRLEDVQREIDGLKLKRKDVETTLEATIQTLKNTLDFVREQEAREREDKALRHLTRHVAAAPVSSALTPSAAMPAAVAIAAPVGLTGAGADATPGSTTAPADVLAELKVAWDAPQSWRAPGAA